MSNQELVQLAIVFGIGLAWVSYFAIGCGIVIGLAKANGVVGSPAQIAGTVFHFGFFWPRYVFGGKELS